MSRRARRSLFALALLTVPFPYTIVEAGRVPAVWLAALAGLAGASAVLQGGAVSAVIARWLAIQAGAAVVAAYLLARLGAWILGRTVRPERQGTAVAIVALVALATAAGLPLFSSTGVSGGEPVTLLVMLGLR